MCTSPIQISRRNQATGQTRTYVVPCGKCEECVSFKQKEFAALSIHQALVSGSLYFFTLTYNDSHLPIAISDGSHVHGFDLNRDFVSTYYVNGQFRNCLSDIGDGLYMACSLRREDIKNWHKQFRMEWKRIHGEFPFYKYCFFGEFGEQHGRPHYHGLIYGATREMADALDKLWKKKFGFSYCVPTDYRQLNLDEIGAVSGYVSKYICKGISPNFGFLLPFVEKPRRICSKNFGEFSQEEFNLLRQYYDGADIRHLPKDLFLQEILKRRSSLQVNGQSFPIPLKLKQKLFYDSSNTNLSGERNGSFELDELRSYKKATNVPCKNSRSAVSVLASKFARSQFDYNLSEQLRQSSFEDLQQDPRRIIRQVLQNEKSSVQFREEIAQENNIKNLKTQKDGQ